MNKLITKVAVLAYALCISAGPAFAGNCSATFYEDSTFDRSYALQNARKIEDRDPCNRRDLVGRGAGNRNWCSDTLSLGGRSIQLVVVPGTDLIKSFAIGRTEISVGEYNLYCELTGCESRGGSPKLPLTNINIREVRTYADWISTETGRKYRIPTVQEWRHAAIATDGFVDPNINCSIDSRGSGAGRTLVSTLTGRPNPWGLFHTLGNARELAIQGNEIFALGGAHTDDRQDCTVTTKFEHSGEADSVTGFRLLREVQVH